MLRILLFLLRIKYIFFWLYRSFRRLEANIEYTKKGITSAVECADVAGFTFATWQVTLCFLCKFISAEATIINLFTLLQVFLVGLGNWSESFGCFIEASSEIWRKIKYLQR